MALTAVLAKERERERDRERKESLRAKSHTAGGGWRRRSRAGLRASRRPRHSAQLTADKDKRRSFFGRLWHEHTHHPHNIDPFVQDPSSSKYAGHPAYAEPPARLEPEPEPELLAPPKKKKKKELTTLKEAAKALPALREESEPPSPISQRGLMDLAEILAETGPEKDEGKPAAEPVAEHGSATPERPEPATPPATPLVPETRQRVVDQLAPVLEMDLLEMDHALALSQAIFDDDSNPSANTSTATSASGTPAPSRAEPATPPATPMPPIERDFAFPRIYAALPEPPTPPATPMSPTPGNGRARHASQLATVLEVEHRLSTLDLEELKSGASTPERKEPGTPPATPATPPPRGGSRQWRLSAAIPPVLEWDGEIERAIAAAVGKAPAEGVAGGTGVINGNGNGHSNGHGNGNGSGNGEKKIRRKPVTLVEAEEGHVARAMAEHISHESSHSIHRAEIVPVQQATAVVLGPVRTPSADKDGAEANGVKDGAAEAEPKPEDKPSPSGSASELNQTPGASASELRQRVPSTHALNPPPKAPAATAVVSDHGWRVPRVRAPPGTRRRSRMFGIGG
jgi:hypothetical protein